MWKKISFSLTLSQRCSPNIVRFRRRANRGATVVEGFVSREIFGIRDSDSQQQLADCVSLDNPRKKAYGPMDSYQR